MDDEEGDMSDYNTSEVDWGGEESELESDFQEEESRRGEEASQHSWEREDNSDAETWRDETDHNMNCGGRGYLSEEELRNTTAGRGLCYSPRPNRYPFNNHNSKPYTYMAQTTTVWSQPSSNFYEGRYCKASAEEHYYHPTGRQWKPHHHGATPGRVPIHTMQTGPRNPAYKRCDYMPKPLTFSGSSKDPKEYIRWRINMKQWLRANNIPKEDKLAFAVDHLVGDAYKWWLKENARTFSNEPVQDWRDFKSRMYREFVKKLRTRCLTTSPMYPATIRSGLSQPALQRDPVYHPKPREVLTNASGKGLKLETHLSLKEEMDEISKSVEQLIAMMKRSPHPKAVKTSLDTQGDDKTRGKQPAIQTLVHQVIKGEKDEPSNQGTCEEVIEVQQEELEKDPILSSIVTKLMVEQPREVSRVSTPVSMSSRAPQMSSVEQKGSYLSQNETNGGMTPKLSGVVCRDHEKVNDFFQLKEEPPDAPFITKPTNNDVLQRFERVSCIPATREDDVDTHHIQEEPPKQRSQVMDHKPSTRAIEVRNLTIKDVAQPCPQIRGILSLILLKEEPPDSFKHSPQTKTRGNLLNTHVLQWTNLVCLCVGKYVLRTKPLEEGGNDVVLASETSTTNTWTTLSAHLWSTSKWNQPKLSSNKGVMVDTIRKGQNITDMDLRAINGGFRPGQEELKYEETCSRILTQQGFLERWNQVNSFSGSKVMNFTTRWILHSPHLQAAGFGKLQSYVWDPGESRPC